MIEVQEAHDRGARGCGARHRLDRVDWRCAKRAAAMAAMVAASAAAFTAARSSSTAARHFGHRWHGHRHCHFGYGFAYNTCWKYTPYGLVNVCKVGTKHPQTSRNDPPGEWLGRVFIWLVTHALSSQAGSSPPDHVAGPAFAGML